MLKEITKNQFDIYSYVRRKEQINFLELSNKLRYDPSGVGCIYYKEIVWYISEDKRHLAIILQEDNYKDYAFVILGICENKLYKSLYDIKKPNNSKKSTEYNLKQIYKKMFLYDKKKHYGVYIDENTNKPRKTIDILKLAISEQELNDEKNQNFKTFFTDKAYKPARSYVQELAYSFYDIDGHFLKEFQLNFDSRLLELYLYKYFDSQSFERDTKYQQPDFCLTKYGKKYFVEARAILQNKKDWSAEKIIKNLQENKGFINSELSQYFSKQYLKALRDKRRHTINGLHYWELSHVKTHPFIIAIQNFSSSINFDSGIVGLERLLYGIPFFDTNLNREVKTEAFFDEDNSKAISAIMFVNNATIGTFNRRGKLQGYGDKNLKIYRNIYKMDEVQKYRIENTKPLIIDIEDSNYSENWSEGITMYHNPNSLYPIPGNEFLDVTHVWLDKDEDQLKVSIGEGAVYSSTTDNFYFE